MTELVMPTDARGVTVSATGPLVHRCPFVDELDEGVVTIQWRTDDATLELHALRDYLAGHADRAISHEALVEEIRADLDQLPGITLVDVLARFTTAGFAVVATR